MRHSRILFIGLVCSALSSVLGSYEHGGYASTHDYDNVDDDYYEPSHPAPPIVHPHHGHSAGSYYHYHVPLVGQQQQHYQPSYHQDHSSFLWPLLLLLALPLLFLPLLPLLLLPLGISLLALLMPGGMMMMMMMMMMGGGMMMRSDTISGRAFNEMRTFGDVIFMDMSSLLSKYARSLDLDQCPQRIACEVGAIFFPGTGSNSTETAKSFTSFILEQYVPKGKLKKNIRVYEKAFWTGSTNVKSCSAFQCHPTFRIYNKNDPEKREGEGSNSWKNGSSSSSSSATSTNPIHGASSISTSETKTSRFGLGLKKKPVNYIYPNSGGSGSNPKANVDIDSKININNHITQEEGESTAKQQQQPQKMKTKRSHYNQNHNNNYGYSSSDVLPYGKYNLEDIHSPSFSSKTALYKMFGTPTIKS